MAYFFNAEEIFQVGIEIEQNGIKFYQKLIDLSKDPELKKTYAYLRSAEENHVKVFQSLQAKVVSKVIPAEAVKEFPEEDMSNDTRFSIMLMVEIADDGVSVPEPETPERGR